MNQVLFFCCRCYCFDFYIISLLATDSYTFFSAVLQTLDLESLGQVTSGDVSYRATLEVSVFSFRNISLSCIICRVFT